MTTADPCASLGEHLHALQQAADAPVPADLARLIEAIAGACVSIAGKLRAGALAGVLGTAGAENVQGEAQKKLDVIANDIFKAACRGSGVVSGMVSEEEEAIIPVEEGAQAPYFVAFDPLDGSSNIDLGMCVGSIFSIVPTVPGELAASALQAGRRQVAAGYALYGPVTMFVVTFGGRVDGFTLDPAEGIFRLTHPAMAIAPETAEFAINMSREAFWEPPIRTYIGECIAGKAGPRGRAFNMRWVAAMVAEVHRILVRGGIFLYPIDSELRAKGGRLRLLYEGNPMAMIAEAAGGRAIIGTSRILDVEPVTIHDRVPVILGSRTEVDHVAALHAAASAAAGR